MSEIYRIGIDLGGTNIKVGVVDSRDKIIAKKLAKTQAHEKFQDVTKTMAITTKELLNEAKLPLENCQKIGIGSPGMIDFKQGVVQFAGNLGWSDVPLVAELKSYFPNIPIYLSNDANCATLGEVRAGTGKGCKNIVMITLGTGVGSGVVCEGILLEGGAPGAFEIGHTLIVMDGEPCTCGRKGCFEAYSSATALKRMAATAATENPDSQLNKLCAGNVENMNGVIPFKAMRLGDKIAKQVVDFYIKCLGEGIINCVNTFRPEKVLLGGGISNEGDPLIIPLNKYVHTRCFAGEKGYVPPIEVASLGNDAGIIGAAALGDTDTVNK